MRTTTTTPATMPAIAPPLNLSVSSWPMHLCQLTYPAAPLGWAVAIAVTVLIPPPVLVGPLVVVPVPVCTGAAGVEEGDESSRQPELEEPPTVIKAEEPPFPKGPELNAARMNEVPASMFVFQTILSTSLNQGEHTH